MVPPSTVQISTPPICSACKGVLAPIDAQEVNLWWPYLAGPGTGIFGFLHKTCTHGFDQRSPVTLGMEEIRRILRAPKADYRYFPEGMCAGIVRYFSTQSFLAHRGMRGIQQTLQQERLIPSRGPAIRFDILKRDAYRCCLCGLAARDGDHVRLEVDHVTPRSRGGNDDPMNLWTLCFACNRGKSDKEL